MLASALRRYDLAVTAPYDPTPGMPDPQVLQDEFDIANAPMVALDFPDGMPCWGIAAIEGVPDGGSPRRMFAPDSLTFAPTPFSLKWQPAEDEEHEGSVVAGRVDAMWREGPLIRWVGCMDSGGEAGAEAQRLIEGQFLSGVSIRADDVDSDDLEMVYVPVDMLMPDAPAGPAPAGGDGMAQMAEAYHLPGKHNQKDHGKSSGPKIDRSPVARAQGPIRRSYAADTVTADGGPEPDMVILHAGRVRSLTILPEPAFVGCCIYLGVSPFQPPAEAMPMPSEMGVTPDMASMDMPMEPMTAAAVASHGTATSDAPWDGPAAEKALPSPMSVATARAFYAWIDDSKITGGQIDKAAGKFGHHEVSGGTPGTANIKACQTGIGVLNGGRGGTTIPGGDDQGVYDHLAKHLRDAKLEPPPLGAGIDGEMPAVAVAAGHVVTAAAHTITIPDVWPESWFQEPKNLPPFGALHITPEGRVYGLLGPDKVSHRAFRAVGRTVTVPRGVDYSEFQNKGCLVAGADGQVYTINAGNVTFGCGHASPVDPRRVDPSWASEHYENSCSIAARIRVGENRYGTWVAGALLHDIDAPTVERMMACALSGDWQGNKLKAALLVPVEGFPRAVTASVRVREGAMVASAVPLLFEEEPPPALDASTNYFFDLVASARFDELAAERFDELAREYGGR